MQTFNYDHHDSSSSESSEEDYINMELVHQDPSFASIFRHSNEEFEFQSFSSSSEKDHHNTTTSPADELFYMGKLLPLHLPPRLEMVQKIFQHNFDAKTELLEESFSTPLESTPFESCNISPIESCHVSGELNARDYFLECSTSLTKEKKSWTKKLNLIKNSSSIGSKLKWANLKSLFTKSSANCTYDPRNDDADHNATVKVQKGAAVVPFGQIKYEKPGFPGKNDYKGSNRFSHRRSFSGAFKMESKCTKSRCDGSLNASAQVLKRSSTVMGSEVTTENPIQAAIAHCKRSLDQQQYLILFKN